MEKTGKNATYTSHIPVVEFVEALGTWVEEALLKCLQQASYYSIMADECTDILIVEEMSVFCCWEEKGIPEEHFLEIIHLCQANAESIYSALVECLKEKKLQIIKIVGMGFDVASTFSGKRSGSPDSNKEAHTPCFVCALPLPLATVGLCSGCKFHRRNQTRVCEPDGSFKIFPLPKKSRISQDGPECA